MEFKKPEFTLDQLHDLFIYDAKRGVLLDRRGWVAGDKGDKSRPKHRKISIDGVRYALHRVIWYYVYGVWPIGELDHIDGNCLNNCISNLREISHLKNMQNQIRPHKSNRSTGVLGVTYVSSRNKYQAQINVDGQYKWLGYFDTLELAERAYRAAKSVYHL